MFHARVPSASSAAMRSVIASDGGTLAFGRAPLFLARRPSLASGEGAGPDQTRSVARAPEVLVPLSLKQFTGGEHSQHGEEGVIDAVFKEIGVETQTCVEIGAYDLQRISNVYSLWTNGWKALLIEGDPKRYQRLLQQYAAHPLAHQGRVTIVNRFGAEEGPDSLDSILAAQGLPVDFDLLCIDVDGLDLHLWRGLTRFRPRLVVVEYNPTIPPHIELIGSGQGNEIGCSLAALVKLAREKGYVLVASVVWNAFFVRREDASAFQDADNLEALFDPVFLRYAMQTNTGEIFYAGPGQRIGHPNQTEVMFVRPRPFARDSEVLDSSSAEIFRTPNTVGNAAKEALLHYLRPVKHFIWRRLGWQGTAW